MRKLVITIISAFLGLMFFSLGIGMNHEEGMNKCIFMEKGAMECDMGFSQHINTWKQFTVVNASLKLASWALALMVFVTVFALAFKKIFNYFFELPDISKGRFFRQNIFSLRLFDPVFVGLYSGVLQPKLYA